MGWFHDLFGRKPFTASWAILAVIVLVFYFVNCHRKKKPFDLQAAVIAVGACSGVVGGILMMASVFAEGLRTMVQDSDAYAFVGGLATLTVACGAIKAAFKD